MDYYLTVPVPGVYEVYAYTITAANRPDAAEYLVFDSAGGVTTNRVNQSNTDNAGWYKLADVSLGSGRQRVVQLHNRNLVSPKLLSADAVMLCLNRRLSAAPRLAAPRPAPATITFTLQGNPGQTCRLETSAGLLAWQPQTNLVLVSNTASFTSPRTNPHGFFRVSLP